MVYWGYLGIMEKKMETTIVYWGYLGIMEKKMEASTVSMSMLQSGFHFFPHCCDAAGLSRCSTSTELRGRPDVQPTTCQSQRHGHPDADEVRVSVGVPRPCPRKFIQHRNLCGASGKQSDCTRWQPPGQRGACQGGSP